jgi:ATP-dependent Lon protease
MFDEFNFMSELKDEGDFIPILSVADDEDNGVDEVINNTLPILALKNTVLFPGVVIPITIGRDRSINAVKKAHKSDKMIAVFSQKDIELESPNADDLFKIGTVAKIIKLLKMPDGTNTAILQGRKRCELVSILREEPYMEGKVDYPKDEEPEDTMEFDALISSVRDLAKNIIEMSPQIPSEAILMLQNIQNKSFLLNFIASNLNIDVDKKQVLLKEKRLNEKAHSILGYLDSEYQILELKNQIESKVRTDIEKQQRDYFLNQQLKTIQEELGQSPQQEEVTNLAKRAAKMKWPVEVKETFAKEINKVRRMNPQVAEYSVTLTYLELLLDLPWQRYTNDNFDLKEVKKVLDKDHYGLEEVKERILEHLAVLKLKGDMKAPIICLIGPPGVGKTSLGKSIARALKRKFVRMSLGGLHDESEIRGHRKTYIGAMPGRIIKSVKKAKSSNPVFILDEIDKIGKDFRGDPSSALLEVLDPEQNSTFYDNYLELEYDLSKVLFIATANSLSTVQPALLDRMEIIEISGYSTEEKREIAKRHLVPQQRKAHGLKGKDIRLPEKSLNFIIENYTRESGVRALDRQIAGVMRGVAKKVAMNEPYKISIQEKLVEDMLGPTKFSKDKYSISEVPGVAVGLAWTRVGGDILFIEASLSKGKGKLTLTGNLGDVMKESATTALSFIKAHNEELGIKSEMFEDYDVHVHVPEGAIPKDGPSAGVTMLTALASVFKNKQVKPFLAMTGEITLRGRVLPVGGIKEKILAAKRSGINEVLLCRENEKHVRQIKNDYIKDMNFIYVDRMEEVLNHALGFLSF